MTLPFEIIDALNQFERYALDSTEFETGTDINDLHDFIYKSFEILSDNIRRYHDSDHPSRKTYRERYKRELIDLYGELKHPIDQRQLNQYYAVQTAYENNPNISEMTAIDNYMTIRHILDGEPLHE